MSRVAVVAEAAAEAASKAAAWGELGQRAATASPSTTAEVTPAPSNGAIATDDCGERSEATTRGSTKPAMAGFSSRIQERPAS